MIKSRLYIGSVVGCTAGYIWLFLSSAGAGIAANTGCLFKRLFHIPCPSCGSTRAILALAQGEVKESLLLNPNGILLAMLLVALPVWMLADGMLKKESYYTFYKKIDQLFAKKHLLLLFAGLVIANWIWNILKEL